MTFEHNLLRRIDFVTLRLFVAVCESGGIGRAAERERIAASAVSKRLSDLETALGAPLLQRHARGVRPSAAGQSVLHHARGVLHGLQRMQNELGEFAHGVRGHVRIHATISAILQFLPGDLGAFARQHESVKIDLEEHISADVLRALQEGVADIGICAAAAATAPAQPAASGGSGGLVSLPYRSDALVLVAPRNHPLAAHKQIFFAQALEHDIVGLHNQSSIGAALHQAAARSGKALRQRIQVRGLDAMCRMIDNGLGIGVLPDGAFALLQGLGNLTAIALADDWARRDLRLVARDFDTLPAAAKLLVAHLRRAESICPQPA
ncbi:MAG: LysR family transcriptional regulator [Burkholderiaceae bacterium]|nr:LysR family transcriptional regulator [Burkholderiaceae bacterium]